MDAKRGKMNKIVKNIAALLLVVSVIILSTRHCLANELEGDYRLIDVVYHASTNKNISLFEPRAENFRDPNEGPVIFATPSIRLASCYLFKWNDSWVHQSISTDNNGSNYEVYMIIADRERFNRIDSGGAIYLLPAKNFKFDKYRGPGEYEWTSHEPVRPFGQINFPSALEAMRKFGVKIYFLNESQFEKYLKSTSEEREKFLRNLIDSGGL